MNSPTSGLATRRGLPIHITNPFLQSTQIHTRKRSLTVAKGTSILDAETGEEQGTTTIAQVQEVDKEKFVKLFAGSIKTYFDLNAPGAKVFSILLSAVQDAPNTDRIYINARVAQKAAEMMGKTLSDRVFHRGMSELMEKQIIAHTQDAGWIFINPAIIFNGNRARFLLDLRRTGKSKTTRRIASDDQILLPLGDENPNAAYIKALLEEDESKSV
jgi:hypothetical protein